MNKGRLSSPQVVTLKARGRDTNSNQDGTTANMKLSERILLSRVKTIEHRRGENPSMQVKGNATADMSRFTQKCLIENESKSAYSDS